MKALKPIFRAIETVLHGMIIYLYLKPKYLVFGIEAVSHYLRFCGSLKLTRRVLVAFGAKIGEKEVRIGPYVYIHNAFYNNNFSNLIIGEDIYIGPKTVLDLWGKIILQNHVAIGMNSQVFTHANYLGTYAKLMGTKVSNVLFEEHSGANPGVTILAGVTIGKNSYITPHSVVTDSIPPYVIARGNPAVPIHKLPEKLLRKYEENFN